MEKLTLLKKAGLLISAISISFVGMQAQFVMPAISKTPVPVQSLNVSQENSSGPHKAMALNDAIVDEDFSKLGTGTVAEPGKLAPDAAYEVDDYFAIGNELTSRPGWTGTHVYSVDGAAALISRSEDLMSIINTPLGDYSGDLTITFRVKHLPVYKSSYMFANIVYGGLEDTMPAMVENGTATNMINLDDENTWTECEIILRNHTANNNGFIHFTCYGSILIDDIVVKASNDNFIAEPVILPITDFKEDGFTANWEPVSKANDYYFTLYKETVIAENDTTLNVDFTDGIPADWRVSETAELSETEGCDGSRGIILRNSDFLYTPGLGFLRDLKLWAKTVYPEGFDPMSDYYGRIVITASNGSDYNIIATVYASQFSPEYTVNLSEEMSYAGIHFDDQYKSFGFEIEGLPEGAYIVFDNLNFTSGPRTALEQVREHTNIIEETSYTTTGLDPVGEYYYSVQSHVMYEKSKGVIHHALGIAAPEALEATNVDTRGSFTANWTPVAKADDYIVNNYGIYVSDKNQEYVVLDEDFSKIDENLVNEGETSSLGNIYGEKDLDFYTQLPGWKGYFNAISIGCLGMDFVGSMEYPYLITPPLSLGNADSYTMELSAFGYFGDGLVIETEAGSSTFNFDENGELTGKFTVACRADGQKIRFRSSYGYPVLFDYIKISQNINNGDQVRVLVGWEETTDTKADFRGLDQWDFSTYIYGVTSRKSYAGGVVITSDESNLQEVRFTTAKVADITFEPANAEIEAIYSIDGRELTELQRGVNIVKYTDGTIKKVVK